MASSELVNFAGLSFLCEKLRLESLLIKHEKSTLEDLNRKEILNQLINSDINVSPENCCRLFNNLYSSNFVEAYKILNQYAAEIVQIYKVLACAPRAVSMFLNATEKITATNYTIDELCSCVFNIIYGSCFFPEDEKNMLELLGHLINLQIVQNPDPRKILRKGNSVFSRMYKCFSESLLSTKIFLTAALHEPIMFLLSQDELFLDIDPSKSPIRIPAHERRFRFGPDENSKSYKDKLAQHRRIIVDRLVLVVEMFINAILNAMPIFPKSIIWLVDQMHTAMIERKLVSNDEAALICTDLIFTYFICSAVIHPEPLGIISDTPIGYIARFNLMQVGQLLQSLAILPYEQRFPSYFNEILSHLDKNSMTKVMDTVLQTGSASIETIFPTQIADSKGNEVFRRTTFVASLNEINILNVLLFEIPDSYEPIGTTSEEEVLKLNFRLESKKCNGQKKTRFLAATDSVVSDRTNTDGVDDTSSSSSNGNAEEAEEDVAVLPDNFSDVVPISANVSRRGSPSLSGSKLSGRETPFSNHAEQNNDPSIIENSSSTIPTFSNTLPQQEANNNRRTLPYLPVTVRKQNSEGLEEKFGKFVLPPQIDSTRNRDETISLVSDNWSTDVVASDNEAAMIELRNAVDASSSSISSIQQPQQNSFFPQQNNFAVQQQQNNVLPINKLQQQISLLNSSKQLNNLVTNFSSNLASSSNIVTAPIAVLNPVNALTNLVVSSTTTANVGASSSNEIPNNIDEEEDKLPYFDQNNITTCRAFLDAKRKLRLVLSNTTTLPKSLDLINYKESLNNNDDKQKAAQTNGNDDVGGDSSTRKIADAEVLALQQMLHLFLADSINSRDRKQAAQIREVLRCLSIFDNKGIFLLLKKLKREQRQRLCYTLYLQQSQSTLLQFKYCLEKMNNRFCRNLELTSECLVEMLVRFHLQKEDSYLKQFVQNFQNLHVQDEKVELVSSTLRILCDQLLTDPIWHFATVENLDYARKCMERSLMAQIYVYALFPNADADYYRDEVLSKSIRQLSSLLSVDHPDLAIPKCLHAECPWSSAQAELNIINAYKSPRDKMNCISRCCETIENLIVLSAGRVTSSADDILPILVFVIIKANPHALLSNLQFIDSFYASRMQGSEAYWWTQFNSAVEFLKTLLNKLCNK
uniref:Receptor-mediated endocytosis protein 6 n=1 Tax=Meloidogyne javanica TaxID=6303 RepID=A0A915M6C1_MELJA